MLKDIHINYKDWNRVCKMAKENGIRTFAELEMYCRIWNIKSGLELLIALNNDYIQVLLEQREQIFKREV